MLRTVTMVGLVVVVLGLFAGCGRDRCRVRDGRYFSPRPAPRFAFRGPRRIWRDGRRGWHRQDCDDD